MKSNANTMDGFLLDDLSVGEAKKALGVKSKAKTSKKASGKVSASDLSGWVLSWMLVKHFTKFVWKYKKAIIIIAFVLENTLLLTHGHKPMLFK